MEIGLYIHWPFCVKKCYYCDLNSHVRTNVQYEDYVTAICDEIQYYHNLCPNYIVKTIFFGGGTPSLMKPEWIERILNTIGNSWQVIANEITLEANPKSSQGKFHDFRQAGINRLSFGVQSFDDNILRFLGRDHTANEAMEVIKSAKQVFNNISADFMYHLPGQNMVILEDTMSKFLELEVQHTSFYSLIIEENTVFGRLYRENKLLLPSDDEFCDQFEFIYETLAQNGYEQYELSNFARPGYQSEHNMIYWEYLPFLGIGPGAHSRLVDDTKVYAIENHKLPEEWIGSVKEFGHGMKEKISLTQDVINQEKFMMKLRLNKGIELSEANRLTGQNLAPKLTNLVCSGDIKQNDTHFHLTLKGFMRYNSVVKYLYGI